MHERVTLKKKNKKMYVHRLFYINNYIHNSNNNYCNKISVICDIKVTVDQY